MPDNNHNETAQRNMNNQKLLCNKALGGLNTIYNKLTIAKINTKPNGQGNAKGRTFKITFAAFLCVIVIILASSFLGCNGNGKKIKLLPSQIIRAENYLFQNYQVTQSIKFGCGVLPPKIQKASVKYRGKEEIGFNEKCYEAGISGKKGIIFDAIAVYQETNYDAGKHQDPVVIVIYAETVLCIPETEYY